MSELAILLPKPSVQTTEKRRLDRISLALSLCGGTLNFDGEGALILDLNMCSSHNLSSRFSLTDKLVSFSWRYAAGVLMLILPFNYFWDV